MSSDETPTFVNCQLKYILINDNWYSSIGMNSVIRTNGAELIWVYYKILFIIQFWPLTLPIKLYIVSYFLFYSDCLTPDDFICWERALALNGLSHNTH
jgi:hypothetical protein